MELIADTYDTITVKRKSDELGISYTIINHSREENNVFEAANCDLYFIGNGVLTRGKIYLRQDKFIPLYNLRVSTTNRSYLYSLLDYNTEKRWSN